MKNIDATEIAYKNGYKQGKQDAVVHGRWAVNGQDVFCSHCGKEGGHNAWGASVFSNYCPNCGAKMDGQETKSSGISQRTVQALELMGKKVHGGKD